MTNVQARLALLSALATLRMVRVTFTTATAYVEIPEWLRRSPIVALDLGRRAPTPIDDMEITDKAVSGTLRFGADFVWCSIPWESVVSIDVVGPIPAQRAWIPTVIPGGKN